MLENDRTTHNRALLLLALVVVCGAVGFVAPGEPAQAQPPSAIGSTVTLRQLGWAPFTATVVAPGIAVATHTLVSLDEPPARVLAEHERARLDSTDTLEMVRSALAVLRSTTVGGALIDSVPALMTDDAIPEDRFHGADGAPSDIHVVITRDRFAHQFPLSGARRPAQPAPEGASNNRGSDSYITWNCQSVPGHMDVDGKIRATRPEQTLGHELVHAVHALMGAMVPLGEKVPVMTRVFEITGASWRQEPDWPFDLTVEEILTSGGPRGLAALAHARQHSASSATPSSDPLVRSAAYAAARAARYAVSEAQHDATARVRLRNTAEVRNRMVLNPPTDHSLARSLGRVPRAEYLASFIYKLGPPAQAAQGVYFERVGAVMDADYDDPIAARSLRRVATSDQDATLFSGFAWADRPPC